MRICISLLLVSLIGCAAQLPFGSNSPKKAPAHKADIPFIQCQVCDKIVQVMRGKVKALRASETRLEESKILDVLEELCNAETDSGEWITMLDLVEEDRKLNVIDTNQVGQCNWECQTVARACNDILEETDLSDFSQLLYSDSKSRAQLLNWLCFDSTEVCRKKPPLLPKDRPIGPKHRPLSEQEVATQKVMRSMKAAGLSGSMMDREQMRAELDEARESGLLEEEVDGVESVKAADPKPAAAEQTTGSKFNWAKALGQAKGKATKLFSSFTSAVGAALPSKQTPPATKSTEL